MYCFISFFGGVQIGPVFDAKGPFWLLVGGSGMLCLSLLLVGLCTAFWHFMLCIGILAGLGTSLIFTPSVAAIGHWFMKRRGNATGIAATGGSVGGVIFPLVMQKLFAEVGFAWATRILGFIFIFICAIACCLVRSRLPPRRGASVFPDFKILAQPAFAFTTAGVYSMEWGLFIPLTYLSSFVLHSNMAGSQSFSFSIVALLNAGSTFGRYFPGLVSDKFGRFNTVIVTCFFCVLTTLSLWLPATLLKSEAGTAHPAVKPIAAVYAVLFGFASGSNISLTPVCIGQLCDTEELGKYYATSYTLVSFGVLTGIPIAGALLQACNGGYMGVVLFTGSCYVLSLVCLTKARSLKVGWKVKVFY